MTETALTLKPDAPPSWGSREEVGSLADRLAVMLPNADKMTRGDVLSIAQYCRMADINPFRGEAYFYKDWRDQLVMVDGYKLLVRWANQKSPYMDRYDTLAKAEGELHHIRCYILRDDRKQAIKDMTELGATFTEAFELVAVYADGVVTQSETISKKGKSIDPPTGWTWEQVAKKRAMKNALNLSHGAPSPREMAELSNEVNGVQTIPRDWDGAEELSIEEAERLAELRARGRDNAETWAGMTPEEQQAQFDKNVTAMRGPADFEGFDTPAESKPGNGNGAAEPEAEAGTAQATSANGDRPYTAEQVRDKCRQRGGWVLADGEYRRNADAEPITEAQVKTVPSLMVKAFPNLDNGAAKKARYDVMGYIYGTRSTNDLTKAEASALITWLKNGEDWEVNEHAASEAARILEAVALEAGQMEMEIEA